ncbi:MAG: AraC family transcriptional regulator [Luteolibacter sp.]
MSMVREPQPRIERLPIPEGNGALGEIFEAAILHDMKYAGRGERNRYFIARAAILVLDVQGEAEYSDETGRERPLIPGDCILLDPRMRHYYGPVTGSHWTEMYVCFRGPIFDAMELSANMMSEPVRHLDPLSDWQNRLRAVLPGSSGSDAPDACIGRLISFLTEAFPPRISQPQAADAWVTQAKRMLGTENLTVAEVSEKLSEITGMAAETVRKRFRHLVGTSMKAWQMEAKVLAARSLLARGSMTQKEIAAALGFSHPQHFSRCLRKATGHTPGKIAKNRE